MVRDLAKEMPKVRVTLAGHVNAFLMDPETGKVIEERRIGNSVLDGGEIWVAELLTGQDYGGTPLAYSSLGDLGLGIQFCHVGVSGASTTEGMHSVDTSGVTTNYYSQMTSGDKDIVSPGNEMVLTSTFTSANGNAQLQEAGLFSSSAVPSSNTDTASRMFNRVNFATISKDTTYTLKFEWHITVGSVS